MNLHINTWYDLFPVNLICYNLAKGRKMGISNGRQGGQIGAVSKAAKYR
ncbi:hypothetical protein [Clostridium botulinum]|nr:hypothetical protein [Clostridium botulinum]BDB03829.1 hypothetical protein CBOS2020_39030 [Clostridium botulinum]